MSNDSSIIVIDSLELKNVNGGQIPNDGGGGWSRQTKMNIPGGGSFTCSPGTVPDHTQTTTIIAGNGSTRFGAINGNFKKTTITQHDTCVIPK
jgi:hypothetical protein